MKKIVFWFYSALLFSFVIFKIDFEGAFIERIDYQRMMRQSGYDNVNTKLFHTLEMCVHNIKTPWAIFNIAGNTIPFYIFGALLRAAWRTKGFFELFFLSSFVIVLCEILQYVFLLGTCDVDDVLMNLLSLSQGINLLKKREVIDIERGL